MMTVTPFEEQVLQALAQLCISVEPHMPAYPDFVHHTFLYHIGVEAFGSSWEQYWTPYTTPSGLSGVRSCSVSMALGRLRAKGLVERDDSVWEQKYGFSTGVWRLTPLGQQMMGVSI